MELSDILSEEGVLYCTGIKSKDELLRVLSDRAAQLHERDADAVHDALANREAIGSTGLGNGIAVPHGKVAGMPQLRAVFARLDKPIDFDSVDDQPVDLVMVLLAPLGAGAEHLKALSLVARLLRTESIVDDLRRTSDPGRLYAILTAPLSAHKAA